MAGPIWLHAKNPNLKTFNGEEMSVKNVVRICVSAVLLWSAGVGVVSAAEDYPVGERSIFSDRAIKERVKASGESCMEGDECQGAAGAGAASTEVAAAEPAGPEAIYNSKCMACHGTGAAGAPKVGTSDWAPRAAKGIDALLESAKNGLNAMPPRGLCMECSDDDLKGVIQYMIDHSK